MANKAELLLRRKAKSLKIPVVAVNEYRTSCKTACCGVDAATLRTPSGRGRGRINHRVKGCPSCGRHWHRDIMAAEAMLNLTLLKLDEKERPLVLQGRWVPGVAGKRGYSVGVKVPATRWVGL